MIQPGGCMEPAVKMGVSDHGTKQVSGHRVPPLGGVVRFAAVASADKMVGGYDGGSISCLSRQQEIRWRGLPRWS